MGAVRTFGHDMFLSRQVERRGPKNRDRDEKDTDIRSREAPARRIKISCYTYSLHVLPDQCGKS